jgi:hypothetical protein
MKKLPIIIIFIIQLSNAFAQSETIDCTIEVTKDTGLSTRSNYCRTCTLWTNGQVPYEFANGVLPENRQRAIDVMNRLQTLANLRFIPRTSQGQFIQFQNATFNSSPVGMQNSGNTISMVSWGSEIVIAHEIFHSLGFFHQHQRPDRENYVQILRGNIISTEFEANFPIEEDAIVTPNIPYDFQSMMHYSGEAFSNRCRIASEVLPCQNGRINTIQVLPQFSQFQNTIGQRDEISRIDALMLRFLYPFPNDRIINNLQTGIITFGFNIRGAARVFSEGYISGVFVPNNANIWVMPGDYQSAEGTYKKPITINAPFGGVILR